MKKIITVLLVLVSILSGCVHSEPITMKQVEIKIYGFRSEDECIFTIYPDGVFETAPDKGGNFEKKSKQLSKSQMKKINDLILKVQEGGILLEELGAVMI